MYTPDQKATTCISGKAVTAELDSSVQFSSVASPTVKRP